MSVTIVLLIHAEAHESEHLREASSDVTTPFPRTIDARIGYPLTKGSVASDGVEGPRAFVEYTVHLYVRAGVKFETNIGLLVALAVTDSPPSVEPQVAVCWEIPAPLFSPLLKATLTVEVVTRLAFTETGGSGAP